MKKDISSIELKHIIAELRFMEGSRLDKITQCREDFYINFYVRAKGSAMLRIVPGKFLYLTKQKPQAKEPDSFCISLRNRLTNSALRSIEQLGSERIAKLTLETKEGKFLLFIELFGKGNIILCNEKGIVVSILQKQAWKDRIVAVNRIYEYGKRRINLFSAGREDIEILKDSKAESAVKAIATDLGTGGVYAEEICILAGMNKNTPPKELTKTDLDAVYKALEELLGKKTEAREVMKNEEVLNAVPFGLKYYESCGFESYASYNGALDAALSKGNAESAKTGHSKAYLKNAEKIREIIRQQEKTLIETEKTAGENQRKAELIYENYAAVKEIIEELNKARQKYSWPEIKERLKGHKMIKSVNEKEKRIIIEI